ncbi:MAG: GNAT family N-acetyltransferase [Pseudomonadota bacterium]
MIIAAVDPDSDDARVLIGELSAALSAITGDSGQSSFAAADVRADGGVFLLARAADGSLLGCGAVRRVDDSTGEIKRMYARPASRGAGAALLAALEREAGRRGFVTLLLATRLVNLRAVSFYQKHCYVLVPNYGNYSGRPQTICLAKNIGA